MKSLNYGFKSGEEGKGILGCMFAIFLMAAAIFLAFKLGPPYFHHYGFKGDMQYAAARAGAQAIPDNTIKLELIRNAENNKILLKKENIKIQYLAGQVIINAEYDIPVNFLIMKRDLHFRVESSSFTTR